ncbi:hypothetical protein BKA93DRAFT_765210 [Sparassis latifolia]
MSYNYYQSGPGWGTSQYRFGRPPTPGFQPTPSWGGLDFFRAHAINGEPEFYQSIVTSMPQFESTGVFGLDEARYWHRRIYGGMVNLSQVLPTDIGSAAAYEAYRLYKYHNICAPLGAVPERQREGLVAMAIAESAS